MYYPATAKRPFSALQKYFDFSLVKIAPHHNQMSCRYWCRHLWFYTWLRKWG